MSVAIEPGCVVSALSEDDHWIVEGATLIRSYHRHKSRWWVAVKDGIEYRFTEECIDDVKPAPVQPAMPNPLGYGVPPQPPNNDEAQRRDR